MKGAQQSGWKLALVGALLLAAPAQAISDADKCEAAKNKIAGKYAFCRQKAEAKAIKKGVPADYVKCDAIFSVKWATEELKGFGMCPSNGDVLAIQACITAHTDDIAAALNGGTCGTGGGGFAASGQTTAFGAGSDGDVQAGAPPSYTDNGDGTITDNNTGLMWEKKDDSGGIHDSFNAYTWCKDDSPMDSFCDGGSLMNGTITTTFLAALNGGGGFAGYTDWRIPNIKELLSIVDYEPAVPSIDPAFHHSATCTGCMDVTLPSCSCTFTTGQYWSSTTYWTTPIQAWAVSFATGSSEPRDKIIERRVRAVRGGL